MPLKTRISAARINLANRRTERRARRQLSAELAAFQTPAERAELDFILSRHNEADTEQIREILNQQDYERQRTRVAIGGYRG
jgi:maltooligosyltrehalose synthase